MNLDYFFIEALATQLDSQLRGALVKKIHQPRADLLLLHLWDGRKEQALELSIASGAVYLCITSNKYRNPMQPPRFCQLLRAHLHRLKHIRTLGFDRRIGVFFESANTTPKCLVLDLFGRHANMLLYNDANQVVDKLRRGVSSPEAEALLPFRYGEAAAKNAQIDSSKIYLADVPKRLAHQDLESLFGDKPGSAWLQSHIFPMSKAVAKNLESRIEQDRDIGALTRFAQGWDAGILVPCLREKVLSMCDPSISDGGGEAHDSDLNRFLVAHLDHLHADTPSYSADPSMLVLVEKARKKTAKRRANIAAELDSCSRHEEYQRHAELLDAHRYLLQRGMDEVQVQNYYLDPPTQMVLPLDSAKTPQENIEHAYNRARKARRGLEHCERRLKETALEQEWLDEVALQLRHVDSAADEEVIRTELIEQGYLRPGKKSRRRTRHINPADLVRRCVTPGGFQLLWGRNSRTNAYLSRRVLKAEDMWFHAHDAPGSHVVLKTEGKEPAESDIQIAAAIAAYYSYLRHGTKAQVIWTRGKHVKQPKGVREGMVNVITYATLTVNPQDEHTLCIAAGDSKDNKP